MTCVLTNCLCVNKVSKLRDFTKQHIIFTSSLLPAGAMSPMKLHASMPSQSIHYYTDNCIQHIMCVCVCVRVVCMGR